MVIEIDIIKSKKPDKNMTPSYIEKMVELKQYLLDKLAHLTILSIRIKTV